MKTKLMSAGVLSVYQVEDNPDNLLLVDRNLYVINGAYVLTQTPTGDVTMGGRDFPRLTFAGFIRVMEEDMKIGHIDYDAVLSNFRAGERASITACPTCGREITE